MPFHTPDPLEPNPRLLRERPKTSFGAGWVSFFERQENEGRGGLQREGRGGGGGLKLEESKEGSNEGGEDGGVVGHVGHAEGLRVDRGFGVAGR